MDILKEIEKQISSIKEEDNSIYIDQIYNHISRAEKYYLEGINDDHYYNDVIYRSNQAYEGALKEAYRVLENKTEEELQRISPFQIESHFKQNSIFRYRVLQLFENYRQEWRNKSTHDYKLIFDESEAFIALTSVSTFVHLLLKQIQEKLAFNNEQERLQLQDKILKELKETISSEKITLEEKVATIIQEFVERNDFITSAPLLYEVEILGMLHGFLSMADEDLEIEREPSFTIGTAKIRPDFVIKYGDEMLVLEVKKQFYKAELSNAINQLSNYIEVTNANSGVLYFVKTVEGKPVVNIEKRNLVIKEKEYPICIVTT